MTDKYDSVQHVVHISTNISESCEFCPERIDGDQFASSVNHYIQKHDLRLLHVGQESGTNMDGKTFYHTVAVLGRV